MSYSTCTTCGTVRRDYDERPEGTVTSMPEHERPDGTPCNAPFGIFPWNDGEHVWSDEDSKRPWVPKEEHCSQCGSSFTGFHACQGPYGENMGGDEP